MAVVYKPFIPNSITVHLGRPNEAAKNITVPFTEYIKNVASSEIYPTWPKDAIKANVLAQISFALNRIYNEWYKSEGYDFDITNQPAFDQTYRENGQFFETISLIVDDIFNNYIVRTGQVQPLFATYCDGKNTTCNGLSQWGSVSLANQGKTPLEILKYYYGNDISIIYNAPVSENIESYPGYPLKLGDVGNPVEILKSQLNAIGENYPAIPIITDKNIFFTTELDLAVKEFQNIFNLEVTGIVDKSTWYKIKYIYNAVKRVTDLNSSGLTIDDVTLSFGSTLKKGYTGPEAAAINYLLTVIAYFDEDIPLLPTSVNTFTENGEQMLQAVQTKYGYNPTGVIDRDTWILLIDIYNQTLKRIPTKYLEYIDEFYPNRFLSYGISGEDVKRLQMFLYRICITYKNIPGVRVTGEYDDLTEQSVKAIQRKFNLEENGVVGPYTWYTIVEYSKGNIK